MKISEIVTPTPDGPLACSLAAPDGPPIELLHTTCDHVVTVVPSCSHCGERLSVRDVRAVADAPGAPPTATPHAPPLVS